MHETHNPSATSGAATAVAHPHKRPNYLLVFLALAVMTALEVGVTYVAALPKAPILLTMSLIKAMLVILYFMHLRTDSRWFTVVFFLPFLLAVPLLLVLPQ
jgi:caa(3)-type oxidase subunit IV